LDWTTSRPRRGHQNEAFYRDQRLSLARLTTFISSPAGLPNTGRSTHLTFIGIRNAEAVYTDDWLAHGLSVIVSNDHILTVKYAAGGVEGENRWAQPKLRAHCGAAVRPLYEGLRAHAVAGDHRNRATMLQSALGEFAGRPQ
jgi:hypothetical protein